MFYLIKEENNSYLMTHTIHFGFLGGFFNFKKKYLVSLITHSTHVR